MTSPEVTWVAGDNHGLVWPDGLALVDGRLELSVAERLWTVMSGGSDLAGFLDALSSACGGLLAIPNFAIGLRVADGVHFAVRGDFRVRASDAVGEAIDISGREAVTWSERLIPGSLDFVLSSPADSDGVARRLASGVVPAGMLTSGRLAAPDGSGPPGEAAGEASAAELPEGPSGGGDPAGRDSGAAGVLDGFPANEDPGQTAVPDDLGVTRVPEPELVTLYPGDLDVSESPQEASNGGPTPGVFDDLWGATVARSVEEAAVRVADDEPGSGGAPNPGHGGRPLAGAELPPAGAVDPSGADAAVPGGGTARGAGAAPSPGADNNPWWRNASGLITGIPSGLGAGAPIAGAGNPRARHGDHDGETIGRAGLDGPFPKGGYPYPDGYDSVSQPGAPGVPGTTDVAAVICTHGHPNPPQSMACRICREGIPPAGGRRIPQPVVGRVRASTGASCDLIGVVVVGRKPSGARGRGVSMPQLLVIPGYPHVSSSHLEIRVDGWAVFARDLGSLNGTFLRRRGEQPSKLTEPIPIYNGDLLDLGHGASVTFEDLP